MIPKVRLREVVLQIRRHCLMKKKGKLRHLEYYNIQNKLDELYSQSRNNNNFYNLISLMKSEANIRLAYRNIKSHKGSKTGGVDGLTIKDIAHITIEEVVLKINKMFEKYSPQPVRRVNIPKEGTNEKRPLGIPTIWDRIFQQCILQILEPICEAKFHKHSYGFRPNRSTKHAVSRMIKLVNMNMLHYCVDIDIKGFFDNVHHGKLIKQMWSMGIKDKAFISIVSRLLKAEIVGEGIPTKGTPQGGIISPILSNIVLNELDWWVSDQWETFVTKHKYSTNESKYRALKKLSNMKEMFGLSTLN